MAELKWIISEGNYYYFNDAPKHATGVTLNKSSIMLSTAGQTEQLTATITPEGVVETSVIWISSDTSVATVSSTGLVTCVEPGECTVTATTENGISASCSITDKIIIDFLLVGGGGGGATGQNSTGTGGNGGAVLYCCNYNIQQGQYGILIGLGGSAGGCRGGEGGTSSFNGYCSTGGAGGVSTGGRGSWGCGASGDGCLGIKSDISGECIGYGGGGAVGGKDQVPRCKGCDGGGDGGVYNTAGCDGTRGGGGGGGGNNRTAGGKGGDGMFIIRYLNCSYNIEGGCKYECGDYTIHCFTSDGTLCVN